MRESPCHDAFSILNSLEEESFTKIEMDAEDRQEAIHFLHLSLNLLSHNVKKKDLINAIKCLLKINLKKVKALRFSNFDMRIISLATRQPSRICLVFLEIAKYNTQQANQKLQGTS